MKATVIVAVLVSIVSRLVAEDLKEWSGWLHRRIRKRAVAKLPSEQRERYEEEWESGLEEVPGDLFRLFYSLGLLRAAAGILRAASPAIGESKELFFVIKRAMDISFSVFTLVLLLPNLLLIALAIRLSSRGPVFYRVLKVGKKGRIFTCVKFRTLEVSGNLSPKVTVVGRFLRKYSLDELPLLINVVRGEMSLVGPRPLDALHHLKGVDRGQLDVAPGIFGPSQIQEFFPRCGSESMDESYRHNRGLLLDLKILARTIAIALAGVRPPSHDRSDKSDGRC